MFWKFISFSFGSPLSIARLHLFQVNFLNNYWSLKMGLSIFDYIKEKGNFQTKIKPVQAFTYTYIHVASLYGIYLLLTERPIITFFVGLAQILPATAFGIAAGAHR